jgi:PadR family transcriptional regulator PadR
MAADGLILGEWEEKETGRKRRYYHITEKGHQVLKDKMQSWSELRRAVDSILEKSDGQA